MTPPYALQWPEDFAPEPGEALSWCHACDDFAANCDCTPTEQREARERVRSEDER